MTRQAKALAWLLLAAAGGLPAAARASAVLEPLLLKRGNYHESFTFIGDLDGGTYVQLSMVFTNLGPGSTKGLCRAVVIPPAGETWKASTRVGRDEYGWKGGAEERLDIGPCTASLDANGLTVESRLERSVVRLAYAQRPGGRVGRDSLVRVGAGRYETEALLTHVAVAATIALAGAAEQRLAGGGYVDHTRSTISPIDLAQRWIRFRSLRGDRSLLVLGRQGHDGRFSPVWACDGARCRDYAAFEVRRDAGTRPPTFHVAVTGGGAAADDPVQLTSGKLLYRDAPVEDLGVLGKIIRPFTGNPVTYVFRGRASEDGGAEVDGILEVEFASE